MYNKKEWIKCSAVAIGFYIAVYVLFAHYFWGFANFWLIAGCIVFAVSDIIGLHWWFKKQEGEKDDYYP